MGISNVKLYPWMCYRKMSWSLWCSCAKPWPKQYGSAGEHQTRINTSHLFWSLVYSFVIFSDVVNVDFTILNVPCCLNTVSINDWISVLYIWDVDAYFCINEQTTRLCQFLEALWRSWMSMEDVISLKMVGTCIDSSICLYFRRP